ncbi:MAG TPA: ComEC/Rec2 family competence protein [Phnomibacter sp.]|nr:ComEC/Rec2 family competence protein [Phnomibacter sp.]
MKTFSHNKYFIPVWRKAPWLRICVLLMLGIVLGNALQKLGLYFAIGCGLLLIGSFLPIWYLGKKHPFKASICLHIALVCVGILLVFSNNLIWKPHFIGHSYKPGAVVIATLSEPPLPKEKSWKANATIQLVDSSGNMKATTGSVILYFQKSDSMAPPAFGSSIVFTKKLQPISNAGNPGGFDYKTFAARQGIYYQVFLQPQDWRMVPSAPPNQFQQFLFSTRAWVLNTITKFVTEPDARGIAQALLIGYRGDLDKALVEQYANTGVVHIIAISGMHLGMIFGLLIFIFKPLGKSRMMQWFRLILILSCIWLFTLLTGAAPSITRAAVMCTILAVGHHWKRNASVYNLLAAAAIVLLLWDPYTLWNVGFQLSFAAVLSIAVFYKPIEQCWSPRFKIWQYGWQMVAVTLAAQILTVPMVVYHFHQFPVYFLLANMIAVPLSGLALYGLILLLAISFWQSGAVVVGSIISLLIGWLNASIVWIGNLPLTSIGHLQINLLQAALMYASIAALAWWWLQKTKNGLVIAFASVAAFMVIRSAQQVQTHSQQKLLVYNVPKHTAIDLVVGSRSVFVGDSILSNPGFQQNFYLLPSRIYYRFQPVANQLLLPKQNTSFYWGGKKITVLNAQIDYRKSRPLTTDILLVSGNLPGNPFSVLSVIQCQQIVLDASNSAARIARWQHAADSLHLRLHAVPLQGAFAMEPGSQQAGPTIN